MDPEGHRAQDLVRSVESGLVQGISQLRKAGYGYLDVNEWEVLSEIITTDKCVDRHANLVYYY